MKTLFNKVNDKVEGLLVFICGLCNENEIMTKEMLCKL